MIQKKNQAALRLFADNEAMGRQVAEEIAQALRENPELLLCVAAGHTSISTCLALQALYRTGKADFSRASLVSMDEWVGLDAEDEGSCGWFLTEYLISRLNFGDVFLWNGKNADIAGECRRAERFLADHGGRIGYLVLGAGMNGHLAFNEPGSALDSGIRAMTLDAVTTQVGQKYFKETASLQGGLTLGLGQFSKANRAVLLVSGARKGEILSRILEQEDFTADVPATAMHVFPNSAIYCDREAMDSCEKAAQGRKLRRAIEKLEALPERKFRGFIGFDGFVDSIKRPVRNATADGTREYFATIADFGNHISSKAGKSCAVELVTEWVKPGGNAFLFGDTLAELGMEIDCVGGFGSPETLEVFRCAHPNLKILSISDPGFCDALEFTDGKVMFSDIKGIEKLNFAYLRQTVGLEKLVQLVEEADVLSFMNWSEVRYSTDIWRGFLREVFPRVGTEKRRRLFLDVSDCSGRESGEVLEMLDVMGEMARYVQVSLSVNANELRTLSQAAAAHRGREDASELEKAELLRSLAGLEHLFIHVRDSAYCVSADGVWEAKSRFIANPKISTGGGDNFNAGLLFGLAHGLDVETAMLLGNAASGWYITQARRAGKQQLLQYLKQWEKELIIEN